MADESLRRPREPMLSVWLGNFFEPLYSDAEATRVAIAELAALGFTTLNLDAKPWEDFFARYRGEPASTYVAMQELMMGTAAEHGMDYTCLALYLCGDNLYPTIRDVPPVRGEDAVRPDGSTMGTYMYWSPRAQATMVDHVTGLLRLYGKGMHTRGGRPVVQTMFDPIAKPSFDPDGRAHYLNWLSRRYEGDVAAFNVRYGLNAPAFASLRPDEYWLSPDQLSWVGCARPTAADLAARTPDFNRWIDNQTYLAEVTEDYFATMAGHWRALGIATEPVLHQWGYFFNPPGATDWQTGQRALDVFRVAPHVDSVLYMSAPLNPEDRADATVLSVEGSIARSANGRTPHTAGLFIGRHVNGDVYAQVPPAEAVATAVCQGAGRLHVYGNGGLDDGGVLGRTDAVLKESLRAGNSWAARVIPLLDAPRTREVAMLFPAEMSLYEPVELDEGGRHRMDFLGWYRQLTDLGWHVDVVHPRQAVAGALDAYSHLVVPHNSLYDVGRNDELESAVRTFTEAGGTVLHGPGCALAAHAFGVREHGVEFDCLAWEEPIIPNGWSTVAYEDADNVATYIQSGQTAIARTAVGLGRVYSFGFEYGHAYCRSTVPIVPPHYGRTEMYPVVLLKRTPVETLLGVSPSSPFPPVRGVETATFGDRVVVVNHRSSPVRIDGLDPQSAVSVVPSEPGWLAPHAGACFLRRLAQ